MAEHEAIDIVTHEKVDLVRNVHAIPQVISQSGKAADIDSTNLKNSVDIPMATPLLFSHFSSVVQTPLLQAMEHPPKIKQDSDLYEIVTNAKKYYKLTNLHIVNNHYVTNRGLKNFLSKDETACEELERVELTGCSNVDDITIQLLADAPLKSTVYFQRLVVEHCLAVTNKGIEYIIKSKNFSRLEHLNIGRCDDIDDEGLIMIANSPSMEYLVNLQVHKIYLMTNVGLAALGNSKYLKKLNKLNISKNQGIDDKGLIEFVKSPLIKQITSLDISGCRSITTAGLIELVKSESCANIKTLKMKDILADRALDNALAVNALENLQILHLSTNIDLEAYLKSNKAMGKSFEILEHRLDEKETNKLYKYRKEIGKLRKLTLTGPNNAQNLKHGNFLNAVQSLTLAKIKTAAVFRTIFAGIDEEDRMAEAQISARALKSQRTIMNVNLSESSSQLSKLEILQLSTCPDIEDEAVEILNNFFLIRSYENLRVIRFYNVKINDKTLIYLARAKLNHTLDIVILDTIIGVSSAGIRGLVASPICESVTKLKLQNFPVDETAIKFIATSNCLHNLTTLKLKNIELNSSGLTHILSSVVLTKLKILSIKKNEKLDYDCAERIARSKLNLETLKLDLNNLIPLKGWRLLADKGKSFIEIEMKNFNYDWRFFNNNPKYKDDHKSKDDKEVIEWDKTLDYFTVAQRNMKESVSSDISKPMSFFSNPGMFITHLMIDCASSNSASSYRINCDVVGKIVGQVQLMSVTSLSIKNLGDADNLFVSLMNAKFLKSFTSFSLTKCDFDEKKKPPMLREFFQTSQNIIKIKVVKCYGFTDEFVKAFIEELPKLTSIDFDALNQISNESLNYISKSNKSKVLKHLRFYDCDTIEDKGMSYLLQEQKLERLTKIDIDECNLITHNTTVNVLRCLYLPRLTEYRFNTKVDFNKELIQLIMNIPEKLKNLCEVKIEFKEIEKQIMLEVLDQNEGTRKDMLFRMAFNDNTIIYIDDELFAQLLFKSQLNKKYLRFCCGLPGKLQNTRMTAESVHKLILKYKEAELDLNVNLLLDNWALLINEAVLLEMAKIDKLRKLVLTKDFSKFKSLQKESIKLFLKELKSSNELITFMNHNTLEVDDDIFKAITDNQYFEGVVSFNFQAFRKLTPSGIKYIFTSKYSKITFSSYLAMSGLSKEALEAEVIVAAFNSPNFDLDSFNPDEYPNLTVGNADFFFDETREKKIKELILKREWMGQNPLHLLDKKFNFPNLKTIRFSNAPSRKCALLLRDFFQSKHFVQIEEVYLENLTLTESFFEKLSLEKNGKLTTFSLKNIQIATMDNVNYTSFALSNVLKNVKRFTFTNVNPPDPKLIYKLSTGQFDFDYLEYGDIRTQINEDFDKACSHITIEKTYLKLKHLKLVNIGITDEFLKMMAESTTLKNLQTIEFEDIDRFTLKGLETLLKSNVVLGVKLIKLSLVMDSTWLQAIAKSDNLKSIESFVFVARDQNGNIVNLTEGMKSILLASEKLATLNIHRFLVDNKQHVNDDVLKNGLGMSGFKKNMKGLDLLNTNITSAGLLPVLTDIHLNREFDMKTFLELHKDCDFIDNNVYMLLIKQDPDLDDIFFTGRFVGVKPQAKLKEYFDNKKITYTTLHNFLERYAKEFDNEGIAILCQYAKYLKDNKISVKLSNNHELVTKEGLEMLLEKIVCNFSMDYDWILHEARWRKLLTRKGLKIISKADHKELAYVDNLDFSDNNYLTSVGYHKMMSEYMKEFYRELGISDVTKVARNTAVTSAAHTAELTHLVRDVELDLEISEQSVLEDTKDFLDNIAQGRVNWKRIEEDDAVGIDFLKLFKSCNFVRVLKLDDKNIGDDIIKVLSRQIWQLTIEGKCFLEEISLKNNPRITSVGMKYLYTALIGNNTVTSIDVSCDENIKLEYNKLVNNGVKYTIVEKMREYVKIYKEKKKIRFYDKYCKYIVLYSIICLPFACYQYHEDRIMKKLKKLAKKSWCAEKIMGCIKKKNKAAKTENRVTSEITSTGRKENRDLFVFGANMIQLNIWLSQPKIWFLMFLNWMLYYSACILPPVLQDRDCDSTFNLFALFFAGYAIFAFCFELWLFKNICDRVRDPVVLPFSWVKSMINVFMSQLSKAAFYTNITFVMSQWKCGSKDLSITSLIFVILTAMISITFILPKLFKTLIFFCKGGQNQSFHTTKFINKMCKVSFHLEFLTISKTLERFATSSSIKIRKQYFPQVMIGAFMKFFIGDTPQVVLKIINLIRNFNNWVDIVSPILNGIKIIQSFNIAMSAKPSVCKAEMVKELENKMPERKKNLEDIEKFMRNMNIHSMKQVSPVDY